MFELFTDPARRVVFFARFEASQLGSSTIESEHFLLGLIREDKLLLRKLLPDSTPVETIRKQINDHVEIHEKISTSMELPISEECKRILSNTAEESKGLGHRHIDTSHLLLGILREENCFATKLLMGLGLRIDTVREELSRRPAAPAQILSHFSLHNVPIPETPLPVAGVVPDADTAKRIAEAAWVPRASASPGDRVVAQNATLTFGVWIVTGSHHGNDTNTSLAAFIQKADGKILRLHLETLDS